MSTTSTRFGLIIPDGTDSFNNEKYLAGNLKKVEELGALKSETVQAKGEKLEFVEVSFSCDGNANSITATGSFQNAYDNPPEVFPGRITQSVSYVDRIGHPYITAVTKTGFTVKLATANPTDLLGAGTAKMKFMVLGK